MANNSKTIADPNDAYDAVKILWDRSRAILQGQRSAKEYDTTLRQDGSNLILPFSNSMTIDQYRFLLNEAELPGLVSQYAKTIIGGLLRKMPVLELPQSAPEGTMEFIMDDFTWDNSSIISFLDSTLWEEMQTSRAWIQVDYPAVDLNLMSPEQRAMVKPYPITHKAESIINWSNGMHPTTGTYGLMMVIIRNYQAVVNPTTLHNEYLDTVTVHKLDEQGYYCVDTYQPNDVDAGVQTDASGDLVQNYPSANGIGRFILQNSNTNIMINGERMDFIPIFPFNGETDVQEPILTNMINREIGLYNKVTRRNHLLYGAATYTPYVKSAMTDTEFDQLISGGLGSWLSIGVDDEIGILATPTDALTDYDRSIESTIDEMARMGMRLLAPETAESGVALEIRNAAQTSQLGTLNIKVSQQMRKVIRLMINWRYGTDFAEQDFKFTLSQDFNPAPLGEQYLRLVTEWYQSGMVPRSLFIDIGKQNDVIPADYDDEEGQTEIEADELIATPREQMDLERDAMRATNMEINNEAS